MTPDPNEMPESKFVHLLFNWGFDNGYTFLNSEMSDLYNRLSADLAPTSQWRSMDTAPRDGTKIVVYRPVFIEDYIPQVGTDYFGGRGASWQESNYRCQPTHWMPLPDAPPTKDLAAARKEKS